MPDSIPTKVPGLILRFALESDVELILELSEWIVYRLTRQRSKIFPAGSKPIHSWACVQPVRLEGVGLWQSQRPMEAEHKRKGAV